MNQSVCWKMLLVCLLFSKGLSVSNKSNKGLGSWTYTDVMGELSVLSTTTGRNSQLCSLGLFCLLFCFGFPLSVCRLCKLSQSPGSDSPVRSAKSSMPSRVSLVSSGQEKSSCSNCPCFLHSSDSVDKEDNFERKNVFLLINKKRRPAHPVLA